MKTLLTTILFCFLSFSCVKTHEVDVLIIGGGASGTTAGIQSARLGARTLIIEEHTWLGGMLTAAGVSAIDGNHKLPAGLWGEFRDKLFEHYGHEDELRTGWVSKVLFEPSVGNKIWKKLAAEESNLDIWYESIHQTIHKEKGYWLVEGTKAGTPFRIKARLLIDGTELGDVAKACGVSYDIGMEARSICGEAIAGEEANDIIQDITYVAVLKEYDRDVTIEKPENYDPSLFYCTCESPLCVDPQEKNRQTDCAYMMKYGKLPNNKYMINWPIEGNDYYLNIIEMSREERQEALKEAKNITLCYLYYLQTELGFNTFGLADDEFPTEDRLPFIPYHRESRRIHGLVRFNLNHVTHPYDQLQKLYRTTIAVGDYPVDHHHARYHGWADLPELHFYPIPSYGLPIGTLIPQQVDGLIVAEKSISISNLINGMTRLQPVVMQIGQAAGIIAGLAIQKNIPVAELPVREIQQTLLNAGGYLLPYLDVPVSDPAFQPLQKAGATGILRGRGMNVGWENQTWLDADSVLISKDLINGLKDFFLLLIAQ
ncbi:MAG: FAD-dependent oxidoreductase [Tannerellaceae bacterium]|nr:FAD-dependent oxidoreductase [Tannerellaceae bacterium]